MGDLRNFSDDQIILDSTSKKKSGRGVKGALIGTAAVATAGAVALTTVPSVKNTVKMTFSSPEEYFADVVRRNALESSAELAKAYASACAKNSENEAEKGRLSLTLGEEIAEDAGLRSGTEFAMDYSVTAKEKELAADLGFSAGGNALADVSAVYSGDMLYLGIPTISNAWLTVTSDEIEEAMGDMMSSDIDLDDLDTSKITLWDGTVLSQEVTDRIYSKYTDIFLKYTKDVKLTKNQELTSKSGITVKYTEAALSYTESDIYSISQDIISAARDDADIQAIWTAAGGKDIKEYTDFIDQQLDDIEKQKANAGDGTVEIKLYIGSDGTIMGSSADVKEMTESSDYSSSVSAVLFRKGSDFSYELTADTNSEYSSEYGDDFNSSSSNKADVVIDGTYSKGVINGAGKATITEKSSYMDEPEVITFDIALKDINRKALVKGEFEGTVSISGGNEDGSVDISVSGEKDKAEVTIGFAEDGKDLFRLSCTAEKCAPAELGKPEGDTYKLLDEDEVIKYFRGCDLDKLKSNFEGARSALGDELTDEIVEMIDELKDELENYGGNYTEPDPKRAGSDIEWQ